MAEPLTESTPRAVDGEHAARLARLIRKQFAFVWRLLRRIGITESEADAAAQEVFAAAGQRIGDIRPGSERSFLLSTTLHVAARTRRNREEQAAPLGDNAMALEDLDEQQQAREVLGALLEQMPLELRLVFVLHEIEQLTDAEIADVVGIPASTVHTRLNEAQEDFATHLESDSDYSLALIAAARAEQAPTDAVPRALRAAGIRVTAAEAELVASGSPAARSSRSSRAAAGARSPFTLAAKWLVLGWIAGLVVGSVVYALRDAAGSTIRHDAAAR